MGPNQKEQCELGLPSLHSSSRIAICLCFLSQDWKTTRVGLDKMYYGSEKEPLNMPR